jgi:damage-control phosphatase, subfamily I
MKFQPQCIDCSKKQAERIYGIGVAAQGKPRDPSVQQRLLKKVEVGLAVMDCSLSPAELSLFAIRAAAEASGCSDPFSEIKKATNQQALLLLSSLRSKVRDAPDPVLTACQLSACGNIIDLGIQESFDIHRTIETVLQDGFAIDESSLFIKEIEAITLSGDASLLYLCDNAGEIVFDRLFIETLLEAYPGLQITAVVRKYPVLNDATMDDAIEVGLTDVVPVIDNGSDGLGTMLSTISKNCRDLFENSDIVLAKGQANFETLSDETKSIYFVLQAKCEVIAEALGVRLYDAVMTRSPFL